MSEALSPAVKVAVIGAGAMGSGIAQVAARAGHVVRLYDADGAAVARSLAGIDKDLRCLVGRGKLDAAAAAATLARIRPAARLADLADVGLAVEAIVEDLDAKRCLFIDLEARLSATAILASNTSSLSITAIAAAMARPARLAGMHFFIPAPRMALVEVVSGLATDPQVAATLHATAAAWGKIPVHTRSTPGFIVNRVARPFYGEALRVLGEQAAAPATLDAVMREAGGFPMGPFELMDLIGLDVNLAVSRAVCDGYFGDRRFTPTLLQQELVLAGRLGRKSGQGFYNYAEGVEKPDPATEPPAAGVDWIEVAGDLGPAAALVDRLAGAGIIIDRGAADGVGFMRIGAARLHLSDGRTATRRAHEEACPALVLMDLARDYTRTPRLALAAADDCPPADFAAVVGTLQTAGIAVSRIDDVAGMIVLRTVAMLANEAADGVLQGIGSAADIDAAMRHGTNYPEGPLAWADRLGASFLTTVMVHLHRHYGDERYRRSPLLERLSLGGRRFHGFAGQVRSQRPAFPDAPGG